jgi:hypothetical protein
MKRILLCLHNWIGQFYDPLRFIRACFFLPRFFTDWRRYSSIPGAEPIRLLDTWPQLHDRSKRTQIDAHYFHMTGWAFRQIVATKPCLHVDVGSHNLFINVLSAVLPVVFVDWRPLPVQLVGLSQVAGDLRRLPFANESIESLSCLHVAEHIGLGRYGDDLDPRGTENAARELRRVLARDGSLYFALPVGRSRLCFNAHRIYDPEQIQEFFPDLHLVDFAAVSDRGDFCENVSPIDFSHSNYSCGMFRYVKT